MKKAQNLLVCGINALILRVTYTLRLIHLLSSVKVYASWHISPSLPPRFKHEKMCEVWSQRQGFVHANMYVRKDLLDVFFSFDAKFLDQVEKRAKSLFGLSLANELHSLFVRRKVAFLNLPSLLLYICQSPKFSRGTRRVKLPEQSHAKGRSNRFFVQKIQLFDSASFLSFLSRVLS